MAIKRFFPALAAITVAAAVAGCGGDDDEQSDTGAQQPRSQEQRGSQQDRDAQVAQRLETYLQAKVRAKSSVTESKVIVDDVQVSRGEAKVYALLSNEIPSDRPSARKVCKGIEAAKVPGVESAVVLDAGGFEILRC